MRTITPNYRTYFADSTGQALKAPQEPSDDTVVIIITVIVVVIVII